jgi:rare lipoprotein A
MPRITLATGTLILTVGSAAASSAGSYDWHRPTLAAYHVDYFARHPTRRVERSDRAQGNMAVASWYGGGPHRYEPNSHTASGERFNKWDLTAAHRSLPFGTRLLVTHGGRSVVVRVNDRGPASWTGRSLDLSKGAAQQLGMLSSGTARVRYSIVSR